MVVFNKLWTINETQQEMDPANSLQLKKPFQTQNKSVTFKIMESINQFEQMNQKWCQIVLFLFKKVQKALRNKILRCNLHFLRIPQGTIRFLHLCLIE